MVRVMLSKQCRIYSCWWSGKVNRVEGKLTLMDRFIMSDENHEVGKNQTDDCSCNVSSYYRNQVFTESIFQYNCLRLTMLQMSVDSCRFMGNIPMSAKEVSIYWVNMFGFIKDCWFWHIFISSYNIHQRPDKPIHQCSFSNTRFTRQDQCYMYEVKEWEA